MLTPGLIPQAPVVVSCSVSRCGIAQILDHKRIGQRAIFRNGYGADGLRDGKQRLLLGINGLPHRNGCHHIGGNDCRVGDRRFHSQRCIGIQLRFIDNDSIALGGNGQSAHSERRACRNHGSGLQYAVNIVFNGSGDIG